MTNFYETTIKKLEDLQKTQIIELSPIDKLASLLHKFIKNEEDEIRQKELTQEILEFIPAHHKAINKQINSKSFDDESAQDFIIPIFEIAKTKPKSWDDTNNEIISEKIVSVCLEVLQQTIDYKIPYMAKDIVFRYLSENLFEFDSKKNSRQSFIPNSESKLYFENTYVAATHIIPWLEKNKKHESSDKYSDWSGASYRLGNTFIDYLSTAHRWIRNYPEVAPKIMPYVVETSKVFFENITFEGYPEYAQDFQAEFKRLEKSMPNIYQAVCIAKEQVMLQKNIIQPTDNETHLSKPVIKI